MMMMMISSRWILFRVVHCCRHAGCFLSLTTLSGETRMQIGERDGMECMYGRKRCMERMNENHHRHMKAEHQTKENGESY